MRNYLCLAMLFLCFDLNAMLARQAHSTRFRALDELSTQLKFMPNAVPARHAGLFSRTSHHVSIAPLKRERSHNFAAPPSNTAFFLAFFVNTHDDNESENDQDILIKEIGSNLNVFANTLDLNDPNQLISFLTTFHLVVMVNMFDGTRKPAEIAGDEISRKIGDQVFEEISNSDWHNSRIHMYEIYKALELPQITSFSVGSWKSVGYYVNDIEVGSGFLNLSDSESILAQTNTRDPKEIWSCVNLSGLRKMGTKEFRNDFADYYHKILPIVVQSSKHQSSEQIRNIIRNNLPPSENPFSEVMKELFLK